MRKILKKSIPVLILLILAVVFLVKPSNSKIKSYYSGDALNYNNQLVISSTNTDSLEIFKLTSQGLIRVLKFKPFDALGGRYSDFSDAKLSEEQGRLYVYAVSEYTLYKYDITDLKSAQLIQRVKNSYFEWYYRVDKFGDNLVTVGNKGVEVWDQNLNIINNYKFNPTNHYSVRSNSSEQYIFGLEANHLQIFDRASQLVIKDIPLDYANLDNNHKVYYDFPNNQIFVADDQYTKKLDFNGKVLNTFRHLDQTGYDVDSTAGNDYIYFSNGYGLVKLRKSDLKLNTFAYTTSLAGPMGWAMGLKIVNSSAGDRVVVFNNSSIIVLDENLKKLGAVAAVDEATNNPQETLFLTLDHNVALPGATIIVSGGGFYPQEPVMLTFGSTHKLVQTDWSGRFSESLIVPTPTPPAAIGSLIDIKATGQNSSLTYSISFRIQ